MFSNSRRTVVVPANLGRAHDLNPKSFPQETLKKKTTLTAGRLYIATSLNLILLANQLITNPTEFESIFKDVESECYK